MLSLRCCSIDVEFEGLKPSRVFRCFVMASRRGRPRKPEEAAKPIGFHSFFTSAPDALALQSPPGILETFLSFAETRILHCVPADHRSQDKNLATTCLAIVWSLLLAYCTGSGSGETHRLLTWSSLMQYPRTSIEPATKFQMLRTVPLEKEVRGSFQDHSTSMQAVGVLNIPASTRFQQSQTQ